MPLFPVILPEKICVKIYIFLRESFRKIYAVNYNIFAKKYALKNFIDSKNFISVNACK